MNQLPVETHLAISASGAHITAELTFTNVSDRTAYLNRFNGCLDNQIANDVFLITVDGQEVDYTLPLKKRRVSASDAVKLAAGNGLRTTLRLDEAYDFPAGHHTAHVTYEGYHSDPHSEALLELKSNAVTFTYHK